MDNRVIKNYILPIIAKKLKIPYRLKENLYLLVTILRDFIFYKNRVIYIKIKLLKLKVDGQRVIINFNILLLGNNESILEML